MPRMGGLETLAEIRKINPHALVIVSSGYDEDHRAQEMLRQGAFTFLKKPYTIGQLLECVNSGINAGLNSRR